MLLAPAASLSAAKGGSVELDLWDAVDPIYDQLRGVNRDLHGGNARVDSPSPLGSLLDR